MKWCPISDITFFRDLLVVFPHIWFFVEEEISLKRIEKYIWEEYVAPSFFGVTDLSTNNMISSLFATPEQRKSPMIFSVAWELRHFLVIIKKKSEILGGNSSQTGSDMGKS